MGNQAMLIARDIENDAIVGNEIHGRPKIVLDVLRRFPPPQRRWRTMSVVMFPNEGASPKTSEGCEGRLPAWPILDGFIFGNKYESHLTTLDIHANILQYAISTSASNAFEAKTWWLTTISKK